MLQMKLDIRSRTSLNCIQIQKSACKNTKPRTSYLIARGDYRKTINVIKVLHVQCAPVTGIVKGIVVAYNNRC